MTGCLHHNEEASLPLCLGGWGRRRAGGAGLAASMETAGPRTGTRGRQGVSGVCGQGLGQL